MIGKNEVNCVSQVLYINILLFRDLCTTVVLILVYVCVERKERKGLICKVLGRAGRTKARSCVQRDSWASGRTCRKARRSSLVFLSLSLGLMDIRRAGGRRELEKGQCVRGASVGTDGTALYSNYCLQSSPLVTLGRRHVRLIDRPLRFSVEDQ